VYILETSKEAGGRRRRRRRRQRMGILLHPTPEHFPLGF
jgi:hypothetical protein